MIFVYVITEQLREALKVPIGTLVDTTGALEAAKSSKGLVCTVGDECAYLLLLGGAKPDICIFDNLTLRKEVAAEKMETIRGYCTQAMKVRNSPGTI